MKAKEKAWDDCTQVYEPDEEFVLTKQEIDDISKRVVQETKEKMLEEIRQKLEKEVRLFEGSRESKIIFFVHQWEMVWEELKKELEEGKK